MASCATCGAGLQPGQARCPKCGTVVEAAATTAPSPNYAPSYPQPQANVVYHSDKSKVVAGILGIFLGSLGIHKFYLGKIGQGVLSILFCWTGIPSLVGLIEGIIYLCMSDADFSKKYGHK